MKLNANGLGWKSKNGKSVAVMGNDLTQAQWINVGRHFQLKLTVKGGASFRFDGFKQKVLVINHILPKSFLASASCTVGLNCKQPSLLTTRWQ